MSVIGGPRAAATFGSTTAADARRGVAIATRCGDRDPCAANCDGPSASHTPRWRDDEQLLCICELHNAPSLHNPFPATLPREAMPRPAWPQVCAFARLRRIPCCRHAVMRARALVRGCRRFRCCRWSIARRPLTCSLVAILVGLRRYLGSHPSARSSMSASLGLLGSRRFSGCPLGSSRRC